MSCGPKYFLFFSGKKVCFSGALTQRAAAALPWKGKFFIFF
jgi:hypothetical protein